MNESNEPQRKRGILPKILIAIVVLIMVFLIAVALQPAEYRVSRTAVISAPPSPVFAHVNDLRKWEAWNPWAKRDPNIKQTYEGAPAGVGAVYTWGGNNQVGEGRMTITESQPNERIKLKLDFLKPFASTADAEFTFKPEGGGTAVTWSMSGQRNFVSKAIGLIFSMDKMIGGDFEKGLAAMKSVVEKTPSTEARN